MNLRERVRKLSCECYGEACGDLGVLCPFLNFKQVESVVDGISGLHREVLVIAAQIGRVLEEQSDGQSVQYVCRCLDCLEMFLDSCITHNASNVHMKLSNILFQACFSRLQHTFQSIDLTSSIAPLFKFEQDQVDQYCAQLYSIQQFLKLRDDGKPF